MKTETQKRKRGRPPKDKSGFNETREALIRAGMEMLTERGYVSSSIDEILRMVSVPKGSFYHYFKNKDDFGRVLLDKYISFFAHKLEKSLTMETLSPLECIRDFASSASEGMKHYNYKRGCLIGNMGQEMSVINESFRDQLKSGIGLWKKQLEQCLERAMDAGDIPEESDCRKLADIFWSGWEGAVMRARIDESSDPLFQFVEFYLSSIVR